MSYLKLISILVVSYVLTYSNRSYAQSTSQTVHINRGDQLLIDSNKVESIAFNGNSTYSSSNKVISVHSGDSLFLTVINNDSFQHNITIDTLAYSRNISSFSTVTDTIMTNVFGVYPYYDSISNNRYLGNCGILNILKSQTIGKSHFYWNLHEIDTLFNQSIINGTSVAWNNYNPQYFTVNGKSKPDIDSDSTAKVVGSVSDTIYIAVLNSGVSLHSLHFHGYHLTVIQDNRGKFKDWEKDTFPLESMQSMLWMLVPDKSGLYPVHDHNLTAIAGGGFYPNGMFLIIDIQ